MINLYRLLWSKLIGKKEIPQTVIGIRYLFENYIKHGNKKYQKARKIRVGLMHGFKNLNEAISESNSLIPDLEKAIRKGVFLLLGIELKDYNDSGLKSLTNIPLPYLKTCILIKEADHDKLTSEGKHPYFKDDSVIVQSKIESDGRTTFTINYNLKPEFKNDYIPKYREIYGPEGGLIIKKVEDK